MGNTTTKPISEDAKQALYDTIATQFSVEKSTLNEHTRFADLGADEHSGEELRTNFEDARGVIIHDSFDNASTIGDLFSVVAKYS